MPAVYGAVFLIVGLILLGTLLDTPQFAVGSAPRWRLRDWSSQGYRVLVQPLSMVRALAWPVRAMASLARSMIGRLPRAAYRAASLLKIGTSSMPAVTQEEISVLLQQGAKAGVLAEGEHDMIKRVFRFSDRRARTLMTPRSDIVWIDQSEPPSEIRRKILSSRHTRFPVCDQSLDNLLGIVEIKDLLTQDQDTEPFRIKGRLTLPLLLFDGTRGLKILEMFKASGSRFAVVLDEYGSVQGLLTLTDILEAIVGDLPASDDKEETKAEERSDGSWLLCGRMPIDEFRDLFELKCTPKGDFDTLAGLVFTELGHIPRAGETFTSWGLTFEVVDMDGNRVDRVLLKRSAPPSN